MSTVIKNTRAVTPSGVLPLGSVLIEDGRIAALDYKGDADTEIDAEGGFLLPGFIDIHLHGGGGADFMDAVPEAFERAVKAHLSRGTTLLYPTAMTAPEEEIAAFIDAYLEFKEKSPLAKLTGGLHLEGPYFSNANTGSRGAQKGSNMCDPDPEMTERLLARAKGSIVRWDAAPELDGIAEFGRRMQDEGIIASVAHSDATADQTEYAFANGFSHVTHFYNAVSAHRKREQTVYGGVVEATYLDDSVTVELIGDGCHIPRHEMLLAIKIKGIDGVSVITDAMRLAATDMKEGKLGGILNGTDVIVEDDVAKLVDRVSFAGSIATMDRCLRTIVKKYNIPIETASRLLSLSPAKRMGVDKTKGSIELGKDADLVIVSEELEVKRVIVGGTVAV
ncbi:MAG: N-acetylglucosamine-6-phosphate deacetylase [Clostridia bacterium]|nr:N-acetylglucosamine-6-phosphate deacetylase [Clostridia bacterium]